MYAARVVALSVLAGTGAGIFFSHAEPGREATR